MPTPRFFKSKYFPCTSFMEVGFGDCLSYTWQKILEARKVLGGGSRWWNGDGTWAKRVACMIDGFLHWSPFKPVNPVNPSCPDVTVNEFMTSNHRWWKHNEGKWVFSPHRCRWYSEYSTGTRSSGGQTDMAFYKTWGLHDSQRLVMMEHRLLNAREQNSEAPSSNNLLSWRFLWGQRASPKRWRFLFGEHVSMPCRRMPIYVPERFKKMIDAASARRV